MDKMKMKRGLVFNKHISEWTGIVDLGSVNANLESVLTKEDAEFEGGDLADQLFVFMARAIFKPSLSHNFFFKTQKANTMASMTCKCAVTNL